MYSIRYAEFVIEVFLLSKIRVFDVFKRCVYEFSVFRMYGS